MKITKRFEITVKGKNKSECDQFFNQLDSFCDVELKEIKQSKAKNHFNMVDKEDFLSKNFGLYNKIQTIGSRKYIVEFANKARKKLGYSPKTLPCDIVQGFYKIYLKAKSNYRI